MFDERFFVLSKRDTVVLMPMGYKNPNITISTSSSYAASKDETSPFIKNLFGDYRMYSSGSFSSSSSTYTQNLQPYLIVPSRLHYSYAVQNYYYNRYIDYWNDVLKNDQDVIQISINVFERPDKQKLDAKIDILKQEDITLTFVYKLINEDKWRTCNINITPHNMKLKRVTFENNVIISEE